MSEEDIKKVIGYARTSPGTNEDETSLPGQVRQIESWVEENGHELVKIEQDTPRSDEDGYVSVVEDEDVSGRKVPPLDRPGFSLIVEELMRNDEIDTIVAKTKDRFSRSVVHLFSLQEVLARVYEANWGEFKEFQCVTVEGETLDYELPNDPHEAMNRVGENTSDMMMAFVAAIESAQTAVKTSDALQQKNDDDQPVGRLPYGLTSDKQKWGRDEAKLWLPEDGRDEEDPVDDIDPEEDKFGTVIEILNVYGGENMSPNHEDAPSAYSVGKEHDLSSPSSMVKKMWKKRERYRDVVDNHRPDLEVEF